MKNVEPTDQSSERQANSIDFHRTLCLWVFKIQMGLEHICLSNISLMYPLELIWPCPAMSDQAPDL